MFRSWRTSARDAEGVDSLAWPMRAQERSYPLVTPLTGAVTSRVDCPRPLPSGRRSSASTHLEPQRSQIRTRPICAARSNSPSAAAGGPAPTRWSARSSSRRRRGDRRGLPPRARRTARRARRDRVLQQGHRPAATIYVSLEPCAHTGTPAALHRRDHRGRPRARRLSPPTTRPRRPPAAARGSCATRASRSSLAAGRDRRRRAPDQPAFPQARQDRPPARALQVAQTLDGKVATAPGDSQWISSEASRELVAPLPRRVRRDRRRHRHRARRRPAADRPHRGRRPGAPADPRRLRLRGPPAARQRARSRSAREVPVLVVASRGAAPRARSRRSRPSASR